MSQTPPPWITEGLKHLGTREVPGSTTQPVIRKWLIELGAWWRDDETPWCGVFVGHCVNAAGLSIPKDFYRAKAWAGYAPLKVIPRPAYGCVVVFGRTGGGHVGFVLGEDRQGNLMVLGGNQGDQVSIRPFARSRVLAYVWPGQAPLPGRYDLPVLDSDGRLSVREE